MSGINIGRIIPTFKEAIRIEEAKWKNFRRQLSAEEKARLEKVFEYAHKFGDAGTMFPRPHTPDAVYMCTLLGLMERIEELEVSIRARGP